MSPAFRLNYGGWKTPLLGGSARYFAMKPFNRRSLMHKRLLRIIFGVAKKNYDKRMPTDDVMPVQTWVFFPLFWLGRQQNPPEIRHALSNQFAPKLTPHQTTFQRKSLKVADNMLETKKKQAQPRGQNNSIPGFLDQLPARPSRSPPLMLF